MNNVIPISEARAHLPDLVSMAGDLSRKTYVTVKGRIKAVIVSARDLELMEATLDVLSDPELMEAIRRGKGDVKKGRVINLEDIKKELGL